MTNPSCYMGDSQICFRAPYVLSVEINSPNLFNMISLPWQMGGSFKMFMFQLQYVKLFVCRLPNKMSMKISQLCHARSQLKWYPCQAGEGAEMTVSSARLSIQVDG